MHGKHDLVLPTKLKNAQGKRPAKTNRVAFLELFLDERGEAKQQPPPNWDSFETRSKVAKEPFKKGLGGRLHAPVSKSQSCLPPSKVPFSHTSEFPFSAPFAVLCPLGARSLRKPQVAFCPARVEDSGPSRGDPRVQEPEAKTPFRQVVKLTGCRLAEERELAKTSQWVQGL